MTLHVTLRTHEDGSAWLNDDGSPHLVYVEDDPSKGIVITGPIQGNVTTPDGTVYNVTAPVVSVPLEHHADVSDAIGDRHETEGHPLHDEERPFIAKKMDVHFVRSGKGHKLVARNTEES